MTKISIYQIDEYVTADDKWIGTDVNTYNKTKNFTPRKLSNYFNSGQVINTGVDLLYKYFTITPPETRPTGTLSFETEIGPTVNFSAISTFLLSNTTLKGNYIVEFFDFLVGTNVLLYKAKNINLFGSYKIVSVEEYLEDPNFFVVNVEFIEGNGFIEEDEDYMISLIDISSGSQDLQEVTDIGSNTTNSITANSFIKIGGTGTNILLDDGNTVALSSIGGNTNLSTSQTSTNFTINSDTGDDAIVPLGDGDLAGATLNNYTTAEKNKLAGIEAGAEVNVNADWNAVSGDAQILNKPTIPSITNLVPYTGATSDVDLGEFGIQLGNLEFDNTPTNIPTTAGSVYYNDADGTLDLILKGGNVTLQVGQETVIRVVNKTSTNISLLQGNYQAVRITGAQGQRPKVDLAQATNDELSAETIGLVTETIANNQEGFITTSGLVRDINTTGSLQGETWLDGDILYLSPTVAGNITKVKPVAPNHLIIIGYVIHAHITQGTIFVKVDNGYELDELHNVKIATPANNSVLAYTLATDIWENKTIATALGYTPANDASVMHLAGTETITGVKTFGTNLKTSIPYNSIPAIAGIAADGGLQVLYTGTYPNQTEISYVKGVTSAIQSQINAKANDASVVHLTGNETIAGTKTFSSNPKIPVNFGNSGIGALVIENGVGQIEVATNYFYPNTTEISYVKGVTSSIQTQFSGKQDTLVSSINIKSINGNSLLGAGNLTISATTPSQSAFTVLANNTNASAVPTEEVFIDKAAQTYNGTITWGTQAPTTILASTYKWEQIGKFVSVRISIDYNTAATNQQVNLSLPTDMPEPQTVTGFTGSGAIISFGSGMMFNGANSVPPSAGRYCLLRRNVANTAFEFVITHGTAISVKTLSLTLQYFA